MTNVSAAAPTEPIGSIARPLALIEAMKAHDEDLIAASEPDARYRDATLDRLRQFEDTGSPVISDSEQRKYHDFTTYAVHGLAHTEPDGFRIQLTGQHRTWPRLASGPFRHARCADTFLADAMRLTSLPVKQAVIAPSALSLMYPDTDLPGYSRDDFLAAVLTEHEREVRACLALGAPTMQVDFTEGRRAAKLDPSSALLNSFMPLNNLALDRFPDAERDRIGEHTCPGGDRDSTHSADVDYAELLPSLFELPAGRSLIALAREHDREHVLKLIGQCLKRYQRAYIGVIDVPAPRIETAEDVRDAVLLAAEYIRPAQLGTTDDCGYAPFSDDLTTSRDLAFDKIRARVAGTALASKHLSTRAR